MYLCCAVVFKGGVGGERPHEHCAARRSDRGALQLGGMGGVGKSGLGFRGLLRGVVQGE